MGVNWGVYKKNGDKTATLVCKIHADDLIGANSIAERLFNNDLENIVLFETESELPEQISVEQNKRQNSSKSLERSWLSGRQCSLKQTIDAFNEVV